MLQPCIFHAIPRRRVGRGDKDANNLRTCANSQHKGEVLRVLEEPLTKSSIITNGSTKRNPLSSV